MALKPAVELSYLDEDSQRDVVAEIDLNYCTPSHEQTIRMREMFEKGKLTPEAIQAIMSEQKPNQKEKIVLRGDRVRQLIPKSVPLSQTEDFVCKALTASEISVRLGATWLPPEIVEQYINPIIGDVKLSDLNTRLMEKYYQNLLKVKSRVVNNRKPNTEYLSCHTVREVHKLLRSAFNQAVKWELMQKNPCINATLPQEEHKVRERYIGEKSSTSVNAKEGHKYLIFLNYDKDSDRYFVCSDGYGMRELNDEGKAWNPDLATFENITIIGVIKR